MKVFNEPIYKGAGEHTIPYDLGDGSTDNLYITNPFKYNGMWCVNRWGVRSHYAETYSFATKKAALCYRDLFDNWDRLCARTKATEFTMTEMTHMQVIFGSV